MRAAKNLVCVIALLTFAVAAVRAVAAPTPREILGSELLIKEYLDKLEVPHGRIHPLQEELVERAFPSYLFFVVEYPPAAAANLPEPLQPVNLFAVDPNGRVLLLYRPEDITELFKVGFAPGLGEERCKIAVRVTLLLLRARYPDYRFTLPAEAIKITADDKGGKKGVGKLVVQEGGSGTIEITLTLSSKCDPLQVTEVITLRPAKIVFVPPGAAKIASAEKIVKAHLVEAKLAVDPVRYLDDPVLVQSFPGYLLFVVPPADPSASKDVLNVMAVGPNGKLQLLIGKGTPEFGLWFNTTFGPAASDPRLKESGTLLVRLYQATRPQWKFGPISTPEITTNEDGVRTVVTTTVGTTPTGRKWILRLTLTFGKRGRLNAWWVGIRPE